MLYRCSHCHNYYTHYHYCQRMPVNMLSDKIVNNQNIYENMNTFSATSLNLLKVMGIFHYLCFTGYQFSKRPCYHDIKCLCIFKAVSLHVFFVREKILVHNECVSEVFSYWYLLKKHLFLMQYNQLEEPCFVCNVIQKITC